MALRVKPLPEMPTSYMGICSSSGCSNSRSLVTQVGKAVEDGSNTHMGDQKKLLALGFGSAQLLLLKLHDAN